MALANATHAPSCAPGQGRASPHTGSSPPALGELGCGAWEGSEQGAGGRGGGSVVSAQTAGPHTLQITCQLCSQAPPPRRHSPRKSQRLRSRSLRWKRDRSALFSAQDTPAVICHLARTRALILVQTQCPWDSAGGPRRWALGSASPAGEEQGRPGRGEGTGGSPGGRGDTCGLHSQPPTGHIPAASPLSGNPTRLPCAWGRWAVLSGVPSPPCTDGLCPS